MLMLKSKVLDEIHDDLLDAGLSESEVYDLLEATDKSFNDALDDYLVFSEDQLDPGKITPEAGGGGGGDAGGAGSATLKFDLRKSLKALKDKVVNWSKYIKGKFDTLPKGAKIGLIAAALSLAAFALYKGIVNRYTTCARACTGSPNKQKCIAGCKLNYYKGAIGVLEKTKADLKRENRLTPKKEASINTKIAKFKSKIELEKAKL